MLTDQTRQAIRRAMAAYPQTRSAAVAALHAAQRQIGYLPRQALDEVAELLDLDANALYMLATFYGMLNLEPVGRYVVHACNNLSCYLNGCDRVIDRFAERLGIGIGETTPDGLFTLRHGECLAACDGAPVVLVNETIYRGLTPEGVDALIDRLTAEATAASGRGEGGRG
ncbi:MAG: NADH-quinone oxidoreductase subunit NuoE [Chloroflexi bacterium]|nr:NADH-quinone oxidoreductase subunit NuoE [Chloroflexota bacterium]